MKKLLQKSVHTTDSFQILSPFTSCKCCLSIHDALSDPPFFSNPLGLAVDKGRETIYIYLGRFSESQAPFHSSHRTCIHASWPRETR